MATCEYQSLFLYEPSMAAAAFFASAFGLSTLLHLFQAVRYKTWCMIPLVIGALFETVGYIMRSISASEEIGCWTLPPFLAHITLVLVAPAMIAASVYMLLEKVVQFAEGEPYLIVPSRWINCVFVTGGALLVGVQSSGARIASEPEASHEIRIIGHRIALLGLVVQIGFGILFIVTAGIFHYRLSKAFSCAAIVIAIRWLKALEGIVAMITLRCVFRVVEYAGVGESTLLQYECMPYLFDAAPMLAVLLWLNFDHPYRLTKTSPFGYSLPSTSSWHMST